MINNIVLQKTISTSFIPNEKKILQWINTTLTHLPETTDIPNEITLRIVDKNEMAKLNQQFRGKSGPTNILSFANDPIPGFKPTSLGDLVICAPLVEEEAKEQKKTLEAHWAHLVIHGILHLLNYDHIDPQEAATMESLEVLILKQLGFTNPYE